MKKSLNHLKSPGIVGCITQFVRLIITRESPCMSYIKEVGIMFIRKLILK
jgi:hypothetical protein